MLIISGERKSEEVVDTKNAHIVERVFGEFRRSIEVGDNVSDSDVKAKFENGVLEVTFPKKVEKVPIKLISIE